MNNTNPPSTENQVVQWHINQKALLLNQLAIGINMDNRAKGFWDEPKEIGTLLMLIVTELSEALEGDRKQLMDDHLPKRSMLEVELADAMIRIFDMAGGLGLDLGGAIMEKLEYNRNRPYKHGKKY